MNFKKFKAVECLLENVHKSVSINFTVIYF
jgi:hypothetical protein